MGTIRKQSIQAILILGLGVILALFIRLFLFTKYLSEEEIGLLTVLIDVANILAAFIPLGAESIFVKYQPHFRESNYRSPRGLLFIGGGLALAGLLIFIILFFVFQSEITNFYNSDNKAPLLSEYIIYLVPLVIIRVINVLGFGYARALKKSIFPIFTKEIIIRILTALLILCFAAKYIDRDGLVFWYVTIYFIASALITSYIVKMGFADMSFQRHKLKNGIGKEILYFGLFSVLTSAGGILIKNIDTIMITSMLNLSEAGIYSIAFFIGLVIELPNRALTQTTAPFIAEASAQNNLSKISQLYTKSAVNQLIVGGMFFILVWTNIDNLFALIPNGDIYKTGKNVVLFIGLGKLIDMSMGVNGPIIQNSKYYKFNFYSLGILSLLAVGTNLIFIPKYGIEGAALASLLSITFINIIRVIFLKVTMKLNPFNLKYVQTLAALLITYALATLLPSFNFPLLDIIFRSTISILLVTVIAITCKLSDDLQEFYCRFVKFVKNI